MQDPIAELIKTLQKLAPYEVYLQGSLMRFARYPDRFFTFWNNDTNDHKHYDNGAYGYTWEVEVNYYSTDPLDVYNTLEAARQALLQAGWKISGRGYSVASDEQTHTGRGFTATYLET